MANDFTSLHIPVIIPDASGEVCSYLVDNSSLILALVLESTKEGTLEIFEDNTDLSPTTNIESLTKFYMIAKRSTTLKLSKKVTSESCGAESKFYNAA